MAEVEYTQLQNAPQDSNAKNHNHEAKDAVYELDWADDAHRDHIPPHLEWCQNYLVKLSILYY